MNNLVNGIRNDIVELSDIEVQKKYWLGKDSEHISSYTELMCRLFDDDCFDHFIDKEALRYDVSIEVIGQLAIIRDLLNQYESGDKSDKEIIDDPKWLIIVNHAKIVLEGWEIQAEG